LAPSRAVGVGLNMAGSDMAGTDSGWETVIGLEIHAQLATRSKIFSGSATAYGALPNTQANLVDLGYPGVLPVLNGEAVRMAVCFGLAIGARIAPRSVFARKNYFYPDLPKGYQISQYELPIVAEGVLEVVLDDGVRKRTSRRTPASRCTKVCRASPASISTARALRSSRSSASRTCVPRAKPSPT
jgi:hypothetical protein